MEFSHKPNEHCTHPPDYITKLKFLDPTSCGACETPIIGKANNCRACDSYLHPFCSTGQETLISDIHPKHSLTRLKRDKVLNFTHHCAVCSEEIKGVLYTCSESCGFDVHPQCSQLPSRFPHELVAGLKQSGSASHEFVLQLGGKKVHVANCHVCGEHCGNWAYRCHECSVNVHFWCLLSSNDELSDLTTTNSRGLERHFNLAHYCQGQPQYYSVPMPHQHFPPPPSYYAGGYQPYGNQWSSNQFPNSSNHSGGGGGYMHSQGGGYSNNGGGSFMGRIGKSMAVTLICDLIQNEIDG